MELYIIRHAQSYNNALTDQRDRVCDPPLTELAHRQAQLVAEHLAGGIDFASVRGETDEDTESRVRQGYGLTRLYCSAMWRALQTAEPIGRALGITPEVWLDIHEHGGIFLDHHDGRGPIGYPGKTRAEILERFPDYRLPDEITAEGWWHKGYEDWPECHGRAIRVARRLFEWADSDERIGLVTHGGFVDALLKALLSQLPSPRFFYHHNNTAITRIDFREDGRLGLRFLNRVDHLPPELIT
ncbi:MAG: histidine phosphatase family protein [Anaerolineae bacterium]|nr:histidine phosphatase family protein [Anaerolineae bacterium]